MSKATRTKSKKVGRSARISNKLALSKELPLKRAVLSTQVSEVIVRGLLEGRLRPGDRLIENELVELLGVSRSPVREALVELAQSGIIVREPGRGGRIRDWTKKDLQDLFGVRGELEGYAARLAAPNFNAKHKASGEKIIAAMRRAGLKKDYMAMIELDTTFHELLWTVSGNDLLRQVLGGLRQKFRFFLTLNWKFHGGLDEVADKHLSLLEALASSDPQVAEKAMIEHVVVEKMIAAIPGKEP